MTQTQEPKKRLVSRGEYAWLHLKTTVAVLFGLALLPVFSMLCAAMCGLVAAFLFTALITVCEIAPAILSGDGSGLSIIAKMTGGFFVACVVCGVATYAGGKWTEACMEYNGVKNAVPFTRAHTADLPTNDSLVRASEEPAQAQERILLRAATQTQEKQEKQLLKASSERGKP